MIKKICGSSFQCSDSIQSYFLIIQFLVIGTAALVISNLKIFLSQGWLIALLLLSLALLPLNLQYFAFLKKAHHALSWFAFWASVYFFINWVRSQQKRWLVVSAILFITSALTYEVTVALFPVAFFLGIQYIAKPQDLIKPFWATFAITVLAGIALVVVEGIKPSIGITSFYGDIAEPGRLLGILTIPKTVAVGVWQNGLFGFFHSPTATESVIVKFFIAGVLLVAIAATLLTNSTLKDKSQRLLSNRPAILLVSGMWLAFFGALPHYFANQGIEPDSLRGAAFGLIFISVAAYYWIREKGKETLASAFLAVIALFWVGIGVQGYVRAHEERVVLEQIIDNFVFSLKQEVPYVKENTTFIYVNASLGRTGCIGMMNMLYSRDKLQCIHLMDKDQPGSYIRVDGMLKEDSGRKYEENFIILTFDEAGFVTIIDEMTAASYPTAPLVWEDSSSIVTNIDRILTEEIPGSRESLFYQYMLERRTQN